MIAANTNRIAKARRRREKVEVQVISQNTINAVLWQIIRNNAKVQAEANEEEVDEAAGTILTVSLDDLGQTPKGFALTVIPDPEAGTVAIKAFVQKEKSTIVGLDGGALHV